MATTPAANNHARHMVVYIMKELKHGAMISLFTAPPFYHWCQTNPLLTRPKKDSRDRMVIMDLLWPLPQGSVSMEALPKMADMIKQAGKEAYIYS